MAILQISQITNRKGLTENLPQLAGAELGWCLDSRRLFIGNGTLAEGAPTVGNTEILTEFSDITVVSNYTYQDIVVGYAAQTGPSSSQPVVRSVQAKLDDQASVRDFGAVGDGVTDDTNAINRALYQLYCRETNTQIRRSLFFPAGTYLVTETIIIPTFAKLIGEGADSTIILMDTSADISSLSAYVARYGDSLQQTGANIGNNGATAPKNIEISAMSFQSLEDNDIFLVERAQQCWFDSVNFVGNITQAELENAGVVSLPDTAGVRFSSSLTYTCTDIIFDKCKFSNLTYGVNTTDYSKSVTVSNSWFYMLYEGTVLNSPGPTGFRVVHSVFDYIYSDGIYYGDVNLNVSAYNVFYNVGYSIGSASPITPCITLVNNNNVSINDLFERSEADNYTMPRVRVLGSGTTEGGVSSQFGQLFQGNGLTFALLNNQSTQPVFSTNNNNIKAYQMFYTITRFSAVRNGTLTVVSGPDDSTGSLTFTDDYTENDSTGITFSVSQSGSQTQLQYSSTNGGSDGILTYSITHLA